VNTGEGEMEGTKCHAQCELNVCVRALRNVVCVCWRTVGLGGGGGVRSATSTQARLGRTNRGSGAGTFLCVWCCGERQCGTQPGSARGVAVPVCSAPVCSESRFDVANESLSEERLLCRRVHGGRSAAVYARSLLCC